MTVSKGRGSRHGRFVVNYLIQGASQMMMAVTTPDNLVKVVEKAGYEVNIMSDTQVAK